MPNAEIRLEELSFNADRTWENDEETDSSGVFLCRSVIDFEVMCLNIIVVELNNDFFRSLSMDSNEVRDSDVDYE